MNNPQYVVTGFWTAQKKKRCGSTVPCGKPCDAAAWTIFLVMALNMILVMTLTALYQQAQRPAV